VLGMGARLQKWLIFRQICKPSPRISPRPHSIATSIVISAGVGCYILNEKLRKFTKAYLAAKKDLEKTNREIAKIEAYLERESE